MHQKTKDRKVEFKKATVKLTELVSADIAQRYLSESTSVHLIYTVQMDNLEALYGFSGVVAMLGNVPNSDSGLAQLYETKHAKGVCVYDCYFALNIAHVEPVL